VTARRCVRCHEWKAEEEFAWRWKSLGIRQKACRACRKIQNAQWYESHKTKHVSQVRQRTDRQRKASRQYIRDYLTQHCCSDCGERDPVVLEFDHVRGKKFKDVSKLVAEGYSIATIEKEINKCDVVCANCHRRREAARRTSRR
jgi:hypothetical protein